jgi:hypothetical protein
MAGLTGWRVVCVWSVLARGYVGSAIGIAFAPESAEFVGSQGYDSRRVAQVGLPPSDGAHNTRHLWVDDMYIPVAYG